MAPMTRPVAVRLPALILVLTAAALPLVAACSKRGTPGPAQPAPSATAWAVVDGRELTAEAVDKAFRRTASQNPPLSDEEAMTAKLAVLNDLIVQDLLLARARALNITVSDTELDTAYIDARKNVSEEAFTQELTRRNLTADDMRDGLRRDLLTQKVIEREVTSKITVTDTEVSDFYTANRASFNRPEDAYHIAQIAITPVRDPQITNRTGNDATTPQEAMSKAQTLMERLKSGASFADLAADFSEDPQTAPRGGDLGYVPVSALRQAPPALRDAVLKGEPGGVRVVSQQGAHTIVLLIAKDTAGQKDLSSQEVRDAITQTLRARREQLLRAAYLSALRNQSVVVNQIAQKLMETPGKRPTLGPTAPGR